MSSVLAIRTYLGTLSSILWNFGAAFPVPTLDAYGAGEMGFSMTARLPGIAAPRPAEIKLAEIWAPVRAEGHRRVEYAYDFIEYPHARRRAFHGHDQEHFAREFGVLVHEHCEERLGFPTCGHYFGLPIDGFEAIRRFTAIWGQPADLGCSGLPCIE
jgi:hypothetical protein